LRATQALVAEVASQHRLAEDPDFLNNACVYAQELPRRVRAFLNDFRVMDPPAAACIVSGYPVDGNKVGPTPTHWKWREDAVRSLEEQLLFVMLSSLIGEVFGWMTQQDGHIIHDVFPIAGHEDKQLSTGSEQLIWWHTEDAFHPFRGDYIGFFCLRNPAQVATTMATLSLDKLTAEQIDILFQPRFIIRPDESHQQTHASHPPQADGAQKPGDHLAAAFEKIQRLNVEGRKMSVFFGSPQSPYMCLDPYYMDSLDNDREAQDALRALISMLDENLVEFVLQPGDYCFIDNFRAVHGRRQFRAQHDGNDRWLKRLCLTRDLRKSRASRASATSRVIC
jgi:Fe(II)/alpha-ketoglutarate-dependent arginine beta-hydroxylase